MEKSMEALREDLLALERRCEAYERARYRRRGLMLAAGALATGILVLPAVSGVAGLVPDFLAARAFRLVDQSGGVRAALRTAGGNTVIVVGEPRARRRREFVLSAEPPYLSVRDESGRVLAGLVRRDTAVGDGRRDRQSVHDHGKQPDHKKKGKDRQGRADRKEEESDDGSFDWLD